MPTLQLRFPGGRYHATPWGHHVNEGQIEWPPSPWRLLRAVIACGFATQNWSEIPQVARRLLEKLAAILPSYRLPQTSAAHSRHFMPIGILDNGREKTTLVFDTWANVGNETMEIHWPCELGHDEANMLGKLAACLGYLGRSESWVEAELIETGSSTGNNFDAFPHDGNRRLGAQWEQISLLAAVPPDAYANWRRQMTDQVIGQFPLPEGKKKPPAKLLKERANAIEPYPKDLLDCLIKDTAWWKRHRWSQPPGSQRVIYWRRGDALEVGVPTRISGPRAERVSMMLLALTSPSGNPSALPPCRRTLPQAELIHRAIVSRAAKGCRVECPELMGRDKRGKPLQEGHRHAHILPVDLDSDGHLDHILIYSPMGLGEVAQQAIRTLRRTWTKGGAGELQLGVAGAGDLDALRSLPPPLNRRVEQILAPRKGSRTWISVTPFVPPRFVKARGANTLMGQVNAELASRALPCAEQVDELPWNAERLPLRHFVRRRGRGSAPPPADIGYAIRLRFAKPIVGPLALGYASHFGLGLFESVDS